MNKSLLILMAVMLPNTTIHGRQETPFYFCAQPITASVLARMEHTWHLDSPVPLEDLRHIELNHYDFENTVCYGELIVHKAAVDDLKYIFGELFKARFPIETMLFVDAFDGSDLESMRANNTSAFNARKVAGTDRWSNHSFGCAIDINPLINPYSSPHIAVTPAEGAPYLNRSRVEPGMILKDSHIYQLFKERGWEWGGECFYERDGVIDHHHFQKIIPGLNKSTN